MPKKNSEPVTKEFLVEQFQLFKSDILQNVDSKIDQTKKILESKIEFARKDMREHVVSTFEGLKRNINAIDKKIDDVDKKNIQRVGFLSQSIETLDKKVEALDKNQEEKFNTVNQKLDSITQRLDQVVEKVDRHDEEITFLKSAVSQT